MCKQCRYEREFLRAGDFTVQMETFLHIGGLVAALVDSMMDNSVEYETVLRVYETTYGESDERRRAQLLGELAAQLNSITSAEPENSEAFHLMGLCWYEHPNVSADTQREAEEAFRCCLAI